MVRTPSAEVNTHARAACFVVGLLPSSRSCHQGAPPDGAAPVHAAYATWVVEGPHTPACYNFHNRDVDMRVMVYLSWGFIVLNW
jgi:hypothetical protein